MTQSVEGTELHIIALISKYSGKPNVLSPVGFDLPAVSVRTQEEKRTRMFHEETSAGSGLRAKEGQRCWLSLGMWGWGFFI